MTLIINNKCDKGDEIVNILICDDNVEFMQSAKMVIQRFDKNGDYFFECVRTGKEFVETIKKQERL